jgi:hypothetical protein
MNVQIEWRPAWNSIVESFREHPVRTLIRLAVVVYVTGLIVTLVFGVFDGPRVDTINEP